VTCSADSSCLSVRVTCQEHARRGLLHITGWELLYGEVEVLVADCNGKTCAMCATLL